MYNDVAFIVCDDRFDNHGMQVFSLSRIRDLQRDMEANPDKWGHHERLRNPVVMEPDTIYTEVSGVCVVGTCVCGIVCIYHVRVLCVICYTYSLAVVTTL